MVLNLQTEKVPNLTDPLADQTHKENLDKTHWVLMEDPSEGQTPEDKLVRIPLTGEVLNLALGQMVSHFPRTP